MPTRQMTAPAGFAPLAACRREQGESPFTERQLKALESVMQFRRYETGAYLFWEGDPAEAVYYIRKGHVKLRRTTDDGRDLLLSILKPGDFIVDFDAWDPNHRNSGQAMDDVEAGIIPLAELELLLGKDGDLAFRFAMWMSMMRRRSESKLCDLIMLGKPGALASTLIRLTNSFGVAQPDGILIRLKLTNTELAELVGTTRESINRMLNTLKNEGVIDMAPGGKLRVLQLARLKQMAGCPECPACPKEICSI
jgi:cAMP-binding proteins - catabolite gene activator and regulatory subunit of cAMP-dependent protein kinases